MIKPGVCDSPVPVPSSPGGEDGFSPLGEKLDIEVYQFRRFSPWGLGVIESNANLAGDKMTLAAKRYAPKRGKGNQHRQGWRKSSGFCCRRARSTMAPGPDFQAPFGAGRGWSGGDFFDFRKKETHRERESGPQGNAGNPEMSPPLHPAGFQRLTIPVARGWVPPKNASRPANGVVGFYMHATVGITHGTFIG